MNGHLSSDQINEWLVGERSTAAEQHLRDCPACQAELARIETALGSFREAVHQWSGFPPPLRLRTGVRISFSKLTLASVAVALCVLASLSLPLRQERGTSDSVVSDATLLQQVDAALSRTVPRPMEPLSYLVSGSDRAATTERSRKPR